jgi:hypothetical protein
MLCNKGKHPFCGKNEKIDLGIALKGKFDKIENKNYSENLKELFYSMMSAVYLFLYFLCILYMCFFILYIIYRIFIIMCFSKSFL